MAGRAGMGGRSRRRSGLLDALIDAGMVAGPARPRTWSGLLSGLTVCDEVTPTIGEPLVLDWLCDLDDDVQEVPDAPPA